MYNIYYEATPPSMGSIIQKRNLKHNLRNNNKIVVPRFNTYVMKNSIGYRGAIIWNTLTPILENTTNISAYARWAWKSQPLRDLSFASESPSVTQQRISTEFLYY